MKAALRRRVAGVTAGIGNRLTRRGVLERTARQAGAKVTGSDRALYEDLETALAAEPDAVVAVLGVRTRGLVRLLRSAYPEASVRRFEVGPHAPDLHVRLAAHGPYDVIVDDTRRRPGGRMQLFRDCFWHLAPGGSYLLPDVGGAKGSARVAGSSQVLGDRLTSLADQKSAPGTEVPRVPKSDGQRLADAMGPLHTRPGCVSVTRLRSAEPSLPKIRDEEVATLLAERGPAAGRMLRTVPAVEFASRCVIRHSMVEHGHAMPESYQVPAVSVREYHDVLCAPEQVVIQQGVVLPDSFRHNMKRRLRNLALLEVSGRFAVPRDDLARPTRLEGSYYYLDNEHRGHFGHVMTEQVSKYWAWEQAKRENPDLKVLVALNRKREMAEWEYLLLAVAGIDREDVVLVRGPVLVPTLIAPMPLLTMPEYVHPDIEHTWRQMGDALAALAPDRDYPSRIFCSRRIKKRECHNAGEVEQAFARHGFEIVFPEDYPLPEQAEMFRRADVVGGFAGSAMFNLTWCDKPKRVVMVSSESYTARNEYMIGAVLGHELDVVTSKADLHHPESGWDKKAFESGFTFDPQREGVVLDRILASL